MYLRLLACQISVPPVTGHGDKLRHIERLVKRIDGLVSTSPVDLVVLPELCTIDYSCEAFGRLSELAEPLDGISCEIFGELARRHATHVVFGMPRVERGVHYISQVVMGPDGELKGCYDKIHIAQFGVSMEKDYFTRGNRLFVFQIGSYRIAPIICYDIRVPELCRTLCVDQDVHLILHCCAYARDESFDSWHEFVVTRAMENQAYIVSINRAGGPFGSSVFCPPWKDGARGHVVLSRDETFHALEISMDVLIEMRERYPFLSDRLDDYSALCVQEPP